MALPFPDRQVSCTDPDYRALPRYSAVLIPPVGGASREDLVRSMADLREATEIQALADAAPYVPANGASLTLGRFRDWVSDIVANTPASWVRGCKGVYVIHNPEARQGLTSILAPLLFSPWRHHKMMTVPHKEGVLALEIELNETPALARDEIILVLNNPSDPAVEHRKDAESFSEFHFSNGEWENVAVETLRNALSANVGVSIGDMTIRHEPLGRDTFPDFELKIGPDEWGIEITRIEWQLNTYVKMGSRTERKAISDAPRRPITRSSIVEAIERAREAKSERRAMCSRYARWCLLLVDVLDVLSGEDGVGRSLDWSAFDVVAVIKRDGTAAFVHGDPRLIAPGTAEA